MRLVAVAAKDSSGHYRIRQPINALNEQGIRNFKAVSELPIVFNRAGRPVDLAMMVDIVVLQRPMLAFMPAFIDMLHSKGKKVVVDIDDDFHTAHPSNTAFMLNHPKVSPLQNWHHLGECVKRADLITVSTEALARRYGSHGRVHVVRNCVDDDWLLFRSKGDGHTLGWAGTVLNHPTDLQATHGGVAMALADHPDWRFRCIGGGKYAEQVKRGLELKRDPEFTEWRPLELHPMMVSTLDVGIVPLADTAFNHAKSWLKGIEYAALGIPFVASDLPEYRRLYDLYGLGALAKPKAKEWRRRLNVILDEPSLNAYREQGRETVRKWLTISRNAWRWHEIWESVTMSPARNRIGERERASSASNAAQGHLSRR